MQPQESEASLLASSDQRTEGTSLETLSSISSIPQGKEDDDAVISMLEISSFNENASTGRHSSDVESDKPSRLLTAPFSEKAANVQGHHIVTNTLPIVAPALGSERVQIQKGCLSERIHAAEHVREASDSTVYAVEHMVPARLQESAIFAPSQQKDDAEASVACARVPDSARTPQIVVTPANDEDHSPPAPTLLTEQEIVSISSDPPQSGERRVEGEVSKDLSSTTLTTAASPAGADTQDAAPPFSNAYMPSDIRSKAQPFSNNGSTASLVPPTELSVARSDASPCTSPSPSDVSSMAAAFPLTFKHYHVFALPTGQPASPHERPQSSQLLPTDIADQIPDSPQTAAALGPTPVSTDEGSAISRASDLSANDLSAPIVDAPAALTTDMVPPTATPAPKAESDDTQEDTEYNASDKERLALADTNTNNALAASMRAESASSTVDKPHEEANTQSVLGDLAPVADVPLNPDIPTAPPTGRVGDAALVTTQCTPSADELGGSDSSGSHIPQYVDISPSTLDTNASVAIPTEIISTQQHAPTQASGPAEPSSSTDGVAEPDIIDDIPAIAFALALPTPQENTSLPITDTKADVTLPVDPITVPATEPEYVEPHPDIVSGADPSGTALPEVAQKAEPFLLDRTDPPLSALDAQVVLPPDTTRSAAPIVADNSLTFSEAADNVLSTASEDGLSVTTIAPQDPPSPGLPPSSLPLSPPALDIDHKEGHDELDQDGMNLDDSLPPSSPVLSSSQPRASSPDRIFDSLSSDLDLARDSPPSSPQLLPIDDEKESGKDLETIANIHTSSSVVLGKRKAGDDTLVVAESSDSKRVKMESTITLPPPPNPKRPTQASQKKQFRKLVKPFRSPLVNIEDVLAGKDAVYASGHARSHTPDVPAAKSDVITQAPVLKEEQPSEAFPTVPVANRDRTASAARPFRAPFSMPVAVKGETDSTAIPLSTYFSSSLKATTGVQAAPTIQALQAQVQKLKQAIKIKEDRVQGSDDDKLEALVAKWRGVGREVAWLVWDTVKDLDPGSAPGVLPAKGGWDEGENPFAGGVGRAKEGKRSGGFGGGWGYDDGKCGSGWGASSGWGWDEKDGGGEGGKREGGDGAEGEMHAEAMDVEEDEEVPNHTLGTMLRHMGIDPDTLGWDEDEGDFVGDA